MKVTSDKETTMRRLCFLGVLSVRFLLAQAASEPVVLTIDVENYVAYRGDVLDPAKVATNPNSTTGIVAAFLESVQVGDRKRTRLNSSHRTKSRMPASD